jgi:hypothetical protein
MQGETVQRSFFQKTSWSLLVSTIVKGPAVARGTTVDAWKKTSTHLALKKRIACIARRFQRPVFTISLG